MNRKLIFNSLSGTALYLTNVVVAFIMSPIIIKALGNRDYGLWELVMSVIGYMGLLDMGIGPALVRFVAIADGRQDRDDLQKTMSTSLVFFVLIGLLAALIFISLGRVPSVIAGSDANNISGLGTVLALLGINAFMLFPMQVFIATLMGIQRHYFINITRIVLTSCRAVLTCYLFAKYEGRGLIVLALLEPVFTAIQFLAFVGAVSLDRHLPGFTFSSVTWAKAREMMGFGIKSVVMLIASRLQNQSIPLIIGHVVGLSHIVYFVMPNRLIEYAKGLSQAIGFPLTPYFGSSIGRGDNEELLQSWLKTSFAIQIVSLAMPVILFFLGESFLELWVGKEYSIGGKEVLYTLLLALVADSIVTNSFRMLTVQGKHGKIALVWLLLSIMGVPLGMYGAKLYGLSGVVRVTTCVTIIGNLISLYMACSIMKITLTHYFRCTVIKLTIPIIILSLVLYTMKNYLYLTSYTNIIAVGSISLTAYIISLWFLAIDGDVKSKIKNTLIGKLQLSL